MSGTNLLLEDFRAGKVSGRVGGGEGAGVGVSQQITSKFSLGVEFLQV